MVNANARLPDNGAHTIVYKDYSFWRQESLLQDEIQIQPIVLIIRIQKDEIEFASDRFEPIKGRASGIRIVKNRPS